MKETLKVQDILDYCEECAIKMRTLSDKAIENVGKGETEISAIGACAYFMQEQRMFRQVIPDIIKELAEREETENEL